MRNKGISLSLIAIMVMAVTATTAFGYYEGWNGWMSSGTFYYNRNPYTCSGSGGVIYDSTISVNDTFYLGIVGQARIPFVYSAVNDTIYLTPSTSMSQTNGGKSTGQSSTTGSGNWFCDGYIVSANQNFTIWGTWSGSFTYPGGTPYYSVTGTRTGSSGAIVTGDFYSSGYRFSYIP